MESYFFGLVLSKVVNHIFWISLFNLNKPGLLVYTTYISDAVKVHVSKKATKIETIFTIDLTLT